MATGGGAASRSSCNLAQSNVLRALENMAEHHREMMHRPVLFTRCQLPTTQLSKINSKQRLPIVIGQSPPRLPSVSRGRICVCQAGEKSPSLAAAKPAFDHQKCLPELVNLPKNQHQSLTPLARVPS